MIRRTALIGLWALGTMPVSAQGWGVAELRTFASLSEEQWNALSRGVLQAHVLHSEENREVAVVGAAHVRASTACFVKMFSDIEAFKKSPIVVRVRKLAAPVEMGGLDDLRMEAEDLHDLRKCHIGDCKVKLPVQVVERLERDVDWSRKDFLLASQAVVRQGLRDYINTYLDRGNSALAEYHDKGELVRLADEFGALLDARPGFAALVPEFQEYLARYPATALPGASDFLYWSTENFGVKPVTSVTHVSTYVQAGRASIASKQIYASHYFDASLGLTAALDDTSVEAGRGMYLVYLNRSRIDLLNGFFGGLRRALIRSRLRDGMRDNLERVARKLEASCAAYSKEIPSGH